ncbi:MAG: creatininase family protein [Syntrophobacterales bacterium]|nr:creatininase family protein [Syntrophobacterales bacterium]
MPTVDSVTMHEFLAGLERSRTVIVPCGSIEEHGPHLPLGTDTWHAVELAKAVSEKIFIWVAPPITYGLCRSSSNHPGTITIKGTTLRLFIQDILRGFYQQGLRRFLILSGHAGSTHMAMLVDACEELLLELHKGRFAVVSVNDLGRIAWKDIVETPSDSHAGEVETSVMEYLFPSYVKGRAPEEYPSFPPFLIVRNKRAFWKGGVWGNPGKASREKGKIIMERSVEALIEIIKSLEEEEPDGGS